MQKCFDPFRSLKSTFAERVILNCVNSLKLCDGLAYSALFLGADADRHPIPDAGAGKNTVPGF